MPDSSSLIGQIISHYRIVAKVGVGDMGEVYGGCDAICPTFHGYHD